MLGISMINELKDSINLYKYVEDYEDLILTSICVVLGILLIIPFFAIDILIMPLEIIVYLAGKKLIK